MLTHFLALGDAIIQRIEAGMPGSFRLVAHAADLAGVKDSTQIVPACHIVYLGARPGASLPRSSVVAWDQEWMTVVVVRSALAPKRLTGAIATAGPLVGPLLTLLTGWKVPGSQPLEPISPGAAVLPSAAGTLYIPLRWRARITQF